MLKTAIKIILGILGIIIVAFIGFLIYATATYKQMDDVTKSEIKNNKKEKAQGDSYKISTFNIGYGGLGKDADFFMDGGVESRAKDKETVLDNMDNICKFLQKENSDFYFLQEVDLKASRSYKVDEEDYIREKLQNYGYSLGLNYDVNWVVVPFTKPMGSVKAGLMTMSKYDMSDATRYSLPGEEPWPKRVFDLDRCIMENRIPLENGKELLLANVHLSAYDKGGVIRNEQFKFLNEYIKKNYNENTYMILGGDFNQLLDPAKEEENMPSWVYRFKQEEVVSDFKVVYDKTKNTVRDDVKPYVKGENFETTIDGFLVSPNIEVKEVKTEDLGFVSSDHNPVTMKFKLK